MTHVRTYGRRGTAAKQHGIGEKTREIPGRHAMNVPMTRWSEVVYCPPARSRPGLVLCCDTWTGPPTEACHDSFTTVNRLLDDPEPCERECEYSTAPGVSLCPSRQLPPLLECRWSEFMVPDEVARSVRAG